MLDPGGLQCRKGSGGNAGNSRPVSVTIVFGMLSERILQDRINCHLEENELVSWLCMHLIVSY